MRSTAFGYRRLRLTIHLALLLLFSVVAGCGPKTGKVSGTVMYNGKPLPGGRVTFRPADPKRNSVMAELDEQGHYETVLPAGEVQVSIDNRELEPRTAAAPSGLPDFVPADVKQKLQSAPKPDNPPPEKSSNAPDRLPGKYVPIPDRYYTVEKSGLKFTVQGGDQKQDFELTR